MNEPDDRTALHNDSQNSSNDAVRDELPADLNASEYVGPYQFPDNSRRRIPGVMYLIIAAACVAAWFVARNSNTGLINDGFLFAGLLLGVFGLYVISAAWRMTVSETDALVRATQAVEFAVGHASAQQVWRGVRSRPTWRVFCYSSQEPPLRRGLVLVDAIDGHIIECLVENNPDLDK